MLLNILSLCKTGELITVEIKRKLVLKKDDIQLKKAINLTCIQVRTVRQAFYVTTK